MKNISQLILLSMILIGLVACSSSEDKAQTRLTEIEQQITLGQATNAEENYRQLISDYPETRGALKSSRTAGIAAAEKTEDRNAASL